MNNLLAHYYNIITQRRFLDKKAFKQIQQLFLAPLPITINLDPTIIN